MSGALLFALAGIVFFNRYLFLEPRLPIRLPALAQQALKYSAPCLLTAICGPIILMDHGIVRPIGDNPYLWGALFSVIIAFFIRNMLHPQYAAGGGTEFDLFCASAFAVIGDRKGGLLCSAQYIPSLPRCTALSVSSHLTLNMRYG